MVEVVSLDGKLCGYRRSTSGLNNDAAWTCKRSSTKPRLDGEEDPGVARGDEFGICRTVSSPSLYRGQGRISSIRKLSGRSCEELTDVGSSGRDSSFPSTGSDQLTACRIWPHRAEGYVGRVSRTNPSSSISLPYFEDPSSNSSASGSRPIPAASLTRTGRHVDLARVIDAPDRESILQAVIDRELNALKYERPTAWFRYLNDRVKLGGPTDEQAERLTEIKASRDILAHNRGVANQTYLDKAGGRSRYKIGQRLEVPEHSTSPRHLAVDPGCRPGSRHGGDREGVTTTFSGLCDAREPRRPGPSSSRVAWGHCRPDVSRLSWHGLSLCPGPVACPVSKGRWLMEVLACLNGETMPIEQARVPGLGSRVPLRRLGPYEVWRMYPGPLLALGGRAFRPPARSLKDRLRVPAFRHRPAARAWCVARSRRARSIEEGTVLHPDHPGRRASPVARLPRSAGLPPTELLIVVRPYDDAPDHAAAPRDRRVKVIQPPRPPLEALRHQDDQPPGQLPGDRGPPRGAPGLMRRSSSTPRRVRHRGDPHIADLVPGRTARRDARRPRDPTRHDPAADSPRPSHRRGPPNVPFAEARITLLRIEGGRRGDPGRHHQRSHADHPGSTTTPIASGRPRVRSRAGLSGRLSARRCPNAGWPVTRPARRLTRPVTASPGAMSMTTSEDFDDPFPPPLPAGTRCPGRRHPPSSS